MAKSSLHSFTKVQAAFLFNQNKGCHVSTLCLAIGLAIQSALKPSPARGFGRGVAKGSNGNVHKESLCLHFRPSNGYGVLRGLSALFRVPSWGMRAGNSFWRRNRARKTFKAMWCRPSRWCSKKPLPPRCSPHRMRWRPFPSARGRTSKFRKASCVIRTACPFCACGFRTWGSSKLGGCMCACKCCRSPNPPFWRNRC